MTTVDRRSLASGEHPEPWEPEVRPSSQPCRECRGWGTVGERHEPVQDSEDCPMLDAAGGCSVYAVRPGICRLWGVVKRMACPYGCVPDRWLSDAEAREILTALSAMPQHSA